MPALPQPLPGDPPGVFASLAAKGSPLPSGVAAAVWRGDQLGCAAAASTLPSGFDALDSVLPGGGWPCQALTDILVSPGGAMEWRLLGPALGRICAAGRSVVLVGPPQPPHLPGLRFEGLTERQLVWVQAETPAERLWACEQLVKGRSCGAVVAWLPRARPEQLRRLQVLASAGEVPVFLCRPIAAAGSASAAPLRLRVQMRAGWELEVEVFKRRGLPLAQPLRLHSVPAALQAVLPPRLHRSPASPVWWIPEADHGVVRAPDDRSRRPAISH